MDEGQLTTAARLRGLLDATRLGRSGEDASALVGAIAHSISDSLGYATVVVNLHRPEWDDFLVTTVHGNPGARELLLGEAQDWASWSAKLRPSFLRRGAYFLPHGEFDWQADRAPSFIPRLKRNDDPLAWHGEDALLVPMAHSDGHLLGIISVDEPASGLRPSDEELDVLVAVAAHAALALEQAQRAGVVERHRRALEHLLEVSGRLTEMSSAESVLELVCNGISQALGFQKVVIGIHEPGRERMRVGAAAGWADGDPALDRLLSAGELEALCEPQFEVAGCYLVPSAEAEARVLHASHTYSSLLNGRGPRAWDHHWLHVPLHDREGGLIGSIWADEPEDRLLPSREWLQTLRMFANQAATAVQTAASFEAVRQADEAQRALLAGSPVAIVDIDAGGLVRSFNPAAERLFGVTAADAIGRPSPDAAAYADILERVAAGETITNMKLRRRRHNGTPIDVSLSAAALRRDDGQLNGTLCMFADVSEQKLFEEELRQSQELARLVVENAHDLITLIDLEGKIVFASRSHEDVLGYVREELVGVKYATLLHPDDAEVGSRAIGSIRSGGAAALLEVRFLHKQGRWIQLEGLTSPIPDEHGRPRLVLGTFRDISKRRAAEATIRERDHQLAALFETALDAFVIADDDRRVVDGNEAAALLYGVPLPELVGRRIDEFVVGGRPQDEHSPDWEAFMAAGHTTGEFELARGSETLTVEYSARANFVPGRHLSILRDVTGRRTLEERLQQSQRLESVGLLAGGIAHDFNNLLTAIGGYAEFGLAELNGDGRPHLHKSLTEIQAASERAALLTQQLLAFSRRQMLRPEVLDMNDTVRGIRGMLERLIGDDVTIVLELDPELGCVRADAGQLGQVLVNLAVNARDAMPGGGTLTLKTENVELDTPVGAGEAYVRLTLSDTGKGIAPEAREHIFEPFFTTKRLGEGTGLGLATVYGIVEQSGGHVTLVSEPAAGASFVVDLPRVDEEPAPVVQSEPEVERHGGSEAILLVEDEHVVRNLVCEILERSGYDVTAASTPAAALEICARAGFDLMVTDVVMPGMNGRELAERVTVLHPSMKVLYTSGYTNDAIDQLGVSGLGAAFLQKPFSLDELCRTVRELLDAEPARA